MTLAIMQPYFMPYIGYFQLLAAVDKFVLYDDVNFINRGWVNRNNVLVGGKAHLFTIPLENASQNRLIHEVGIASDLAWRKKLLKTLTQSYQKAPFFGDVFPLVEKVVLSDSNSIADLCFVGISAVAEYMGIRTTLVKSSRMYDNQDLKGAERILSICKIEGADRYINPIGGMELYDKERFHEEGIALNFIKSKPHMYPQYKNAFVPWLSIIDVLMFNSVAHTQNLLKDFELV
jgi:hypothetical protein